MRQRVSALRLLSVCAVAGVSQKPYAQTSPNLLCMLPVVDNAKNVLPRLASRSMYFGFAIANDVVFSRI